MMPSDTPPSSPAPRAAATDARVSVVIPAYNSAQTLGRALASVRRQSLKPGETLIIDDCSTDDTPRIVAAYADIGARLITLAKRGGASNARNVGVREARGEFVAFLDADDEWLEAKLEKQMAMIAADPRHGVRHLPRQAARPQRLHHRLDP